MQQIQEYVSFLLVQVMKAHRHCAEIGLNELGLHAGQEMILFNLWDENGSTQSEIAECLCVELPTVTKMVQRMEAAGLVERRQDPDDARVSRVYLTPQSRELQEKVLAVWTRLEEKTLAGMTDTERMLLRRLLLQLWDNLSDSET
jgi:MarR family transcriptional regulator, organic hydroperoxide resistance regulator